MILELDCGNSLIKWRLVGTANSEVVARGVSETVSGVLRGVASAGGVPVARCRLVSVRGEEETKALVRALSQGLSVDVVQAQSGRRLGGVTNGYEKVERLGMDRWLAVVAAYGLCRHACVVIDLGTAITVDLVSDAGVHLGGYITPGTALLRAELLKHTQRIRYDEAELALSVRALSPGTTTVEAVERGCLMMARSYVLSQIAQAERYLGENYSVYVTGGDAALAKDLPGVHHVPDLVFQGLAIACP